MPIQDYEIPALMTKQYPSHRSRLSFTYVKNIVPLPSLTATAEAALCDCLFEAAVVELLFFLKEAGMDSTSKSEQVGDLFRFRSSTGSPLILVKDILAEFEDLAVELRHQLSDRFFSTLAIIAKELVFCGVVWAFLYR